MTATPRPTPTPGDAVESPLPDAAPARSSLLWRSAACAAVAIVLWAAAAAITFRTEVRITSDGSKVTWTVDGTTWTAPIPVKRVEGLAVRLSRTAYPMGGETLTIESGGRRVVHELPRRFTLPHDGVAPTGDWVVDQAAVEATVVDLPLDLRGPFEIRAIFTGRCLKFTTLALRGDAPISFRFRRGNLNNDAFIDPPPPSPGTGGSMTIRAASRAITALEFLVRAVAAGAAIAAVFQAAAALLPRGEVATRSGSRREPRWTLAALVVLAVLFAGIATWVSIRVLEGVPHTPDEVAYRMQAKWLARGQLVGSIPAGLATYLPVPFTGLYDGKWITQYPIGWPLLLALGELARRPELVNPLLAAVYALLLYAAGKSLFGRRESLVALALATFSPMALLMFGSYLSHASAAVLTVLAFVLWVEADRRPSPWRMAGSGIALGFCFGIRPLTVIAVGAVLGIASLVRLIRERHARRIWSLAAWIGGGVVGAIPVLAHNQLVTGSPFVFAYTTISGHRLSLDHLPKGLMHLDFTMAALGPSLFGWGWKLIDGWVPVSLALGMCAVPLFLRRCGRAEWLLAAIFVAVPVSYVLHEAQGVHGYGARFYFEAYFALYLLAARGFTRLARSGSEAAAARLPAAVLRNMVIAAVAAIVLFTAASLPERLRLYRGYNGVSGALDQAIEAEGVDRGLVIFFDNSWYQWGMAANAWDGTIASPLVFATGRADNSPLLAQLPQRPVFAWGSGRLAPLDTAAAVRYSSQTAAAQSAAPPQTAEVRFAETLGKIDGKTIELTAGSTAANAGRFDLAALRGSGKLVVEANDVMFTSNLGSIFDGNLTSLTRSGKANPVILVLRFTEPVRVAGVRIFPSYSTYDWAVRPSAAGPRYAIRSAVGENWSQIDLPKPIETSELRIELRRLERDDHVHLNELELLVAE